jgi:hypothetical protein
MWDVFQSLKMNSFVVSELPVAHVTAILDEFVYMREEDPEDILKFARNRYGIT